MRIKDWGYDNEQSFVRDAMLSATKRAEFKKFNIPLVEKIALLYIAKRGLKITILPDLVKVGSGSFDRAFNKYIQLPTMYEKEGYLFSTYYLNWIKISIEEYLSQF